MRRLLLFPAFLLTLNTLSNLAIGQNGATTIVTAMPSTLTVGGTVGLIATVQPNTVSITPGQAFTKPTGTITFLDGNTPLNGTPAALLPNTLASTTFQQTFGTLDPTVTQYAAGELTGDLNGDGVADLLVYGAAAMTGRLLVQTFISNGKGGYNPGAVQTFSLVGPGPGSLVAVNSPLLIDLNGDGRLDLLNGLQVAYGNGDGTFAAAVPVSFLSSGFETAYAADLNGDGKTDLLAVNTPNYPDQEFSVTVFLNGGEDLLLLPEQFQLAPLLMTLGFIRQLSWISMATANLTFSCSGHSNRF